MRGAPTTIDADRIGEALGLLEPRLGGAARRFASELRYHDDRPLTAGHLDRAIAVEAAHSVSCRSPSSSFSAAPAESSTARVCRRAGSCRRARAEAEQVERGHFSLQHDAVDQEQRHARSLTRGSGEEDVLERCLCALRGIDRRGGGGEVDRGSAGMIVEIACL